MAIKCIDYGTRKMAYPLLKTGVAVAKGDLIYIDTADNNTAKPAGSFTWNTSLAQTQTDFHAVFLGIADQDFAGETFTNVQQYGFPENRIAVITDPNAIFEGDQAAATVKTGDLIGAAKQSGNLLEPQKVVGTSTEATSIGRITKDFGTNATKVRFQITPARGSLLA